MLIIGARLQGFAAPGSMGVVRDATFINCFWPKLDRPTRIFAEGSSGIKVMGTTPRNVWFPDDVGFLDYYPDALYPAEQALLKAMPFRRGLVNLTPPEAAIWWGAYQAAVAKLPDTAVVIVTPRACNFLRHREEKARRQVVLKEDAVHRFPDGSEQRLLAGTVIEKIDYEEYVAELSPSEAQAIAVGEADEAAMRQSKEFVHISKQTVFSRTL